MLLLKGLKLFSMIICYQIHFVFVRISLASYIALARGIITNVKPPESYVEMHISKFSVAQITHKRIGEHEHSELLEKLVPK